MSNKTQFQANNIELSSLIELLRGKSVGSGSGGSVETCTVTITNYNVSVSDVKIAYTTESQEMCELIYNASDGNISFNTIKNSIIFIYDTTFGFGEFRDYTNLYSENAVLILYNDYMLDMNQKASAAIFITGDTTITLVNPENV